MLRVDYPDLLPLSRLDLPVDDLGIAGAALGVQDNATTGSFLGDSYELDAVAVPPEEAMAAFQGMVDRGERMIVVLADAADLLAMADAAPPEVLIFNARAPETALRDTDCRANVLHTAPSDQMRADALAQYLVWKRWPRWVLIHGSHPEDVALAEAYTRAAAKFGAEIVESREFADTGGARNTDSGHVQVQTQMPLFTQDLPDHDVIVAADRTDYFAAYLPYRTWAPSVVAGSAGLEPVSWHATNEAYGATQMQRRFEALTPRPMREEDFQAWLAVRAIGEAVTRTRSGDAESVRGYLLGPDFELAAFKGQGVTFRDWNGEMRQPMLLTDGQLTVSVSPQEGFLHQTSTLDTLGLDRPESQCTAFGGQP